MKGNNQLYLMHKKIVTKGDAMNRNNDINSSGSYDVSQHLGSDVMNVCLKQQRFTVLVPESRS